MRLFFLGLAIGAAAALTTTMFLEGGPSIEAAGPDFDSAGEELDEVERLEAKVATLEAQIQSRGGTGGERQSDGSVEEAVTSRKAAKPIDAAIKSERLKRELDRLIASGLVASKYRKNEQALFAFLVESWSAGGRPDEALTLLQLFQGSFPVQNYAHSVGAALLKSGQKGLAVEAYLLGAKKNVGATVNALLKIAPERALAALDDPSLMKKQGSSVRYNRIRLLTSMGRVEEAFALADAQMREKNFASAAWRDLVKASPTEAETRLRKLLETTPAGKTKRAYEMHLVTSLHKQGRVDDAVATLEAGLAKHFDTSWVRKLGEINRARALALLEKRTRAKPNDQASLNLLGSELVRAGRKADAFRVLDRAMSLGYKENVAQSMLAADPLRAVQRIAPRAMQKRDDEMLGDMADALWKAGFRSRARNYYEEALRFDSDDSEWVRKTKLVRAGKSPFGKG